MVEVAGRGFRGRLGASAEGSDAGDLRCPESLQQSKCKVDAGSVCTHQSPRAKVKNLK